MMDLTDLPPALVKELLIATPMDLKVLSLFDSGAKGLDDLLIGFYRVHGQIRTRQWAMMNCYRLYRKKELLEPAEGKGCYKLSAYGKEVLNKLNPPPQERP